MPLFARGASLAVSATSSHDKAALERMIDAARWRHLHLDWFDPLLLIEETPFLKLARGHTLLACLACPPEIPHHGWIRVLAVAGAVELQQAWDHLWPNVVQAARKVGLSTIAVLQSASWLTPLIGTAGFEITDEVVFLERDNVSSSPSTPPLGSIRGMTLDDLPALLRLDAQAFPEPWQMSRRSLQAALRSAAYASLLECQGEILGYQITSRSPYSAHLSRLAVAAGRKRLGLGTALTLDAMRTLAGQAPTRWTVNTQASNQAALALYQRLGFRLTGVRYAMHTLHL
jgi:ribosomal-protein-alanine N-acetyltransferase